MIILVVWIIFGLVVGLFTSRFFHHTAGTLALDMMLGVTAAIAGGLAMSLLGFPQTTPLLVAGLFGAAAGSVAILAGYRAIFSRA